MGETLQYVGLKPFQRKDNGEREEKAVGNCGRLKEVRIVIYYLP
jgi:hypothetical protein